MTVQLPRLTLKIHPQQLKNNKILNLVRIFRLESRVSQSRNCILPISVEFQVFRLGVSLPCEAVLGTHCAVQQVGDRLRWDGDRSNQGL